MANQHAWRGKEKDMELKLQEVVKDYMNDLEYIEMALDRKWGWSQEFLLGMYKQVTRTLSWNLFNVKDWDNYKIRHATRREKKTFTRHITSKATSWDVAVNKLYGITIEEGKEYTVHEKPWGIIELLGKKYPVYSDDPGQCDYIVIDGECLSGGTYNFFPECEFISQILDHIGHQTYKKIKGEK